MQALSSQGEPQGPGPNAAASRGRSFTDWCRGWSRPILLPVARFLGRLGLSPNAVSLLGLAVYAVAGIILALGYPAAAGWMLAVFGPLDAVDGLLARDQGRETRFGAFLDSTADRYAEFFLFLGLLAYLLRFTDAGLFEAGLVLTALTGSLLVSYARARAEALGFSCRVGLFTRLERLVLLAVGLIFGWILAVLWVLAVLTHVTALQRIHHVYRQFGADE